MPIEFAKLHGAGNDYIYVNCLEGLPVPDARLFELARAVAERHRGVGADGLILVLPPPDDTVAFGFRMFNSDGSEGEMCGNGMRCFARYVWENGLIRRTEFAVATAAGPIQCWLTPGEASAPWSVTCDLGPPRLAPASVPTTLVADEAGYVRDRPFQLGGRRFLLTAVSTGVPHAVIFVDDPESLPWRELGRAIEDHAAFPQRTNVEFVQVLAEDRAQAYVWERGSGETLACGTGACAVAVAGAITGRLGREVVVGLPGGDLGVEWREADDHVLLSGPAALVCTGVFVLPAAE